jgi:hypothetical protein
MSELPGSTFKATSNAGQRQDAGFKPGARNTKATSPHAKMPRVTEKLSVAETATFVCMQELNGSTASPKESEAIHEACKELLKIQARRPSWPVPGEPAEEYEE